MRLDKRAFTLLELLVSISLIMLLVSFVAVSLRGVRASASRAKSLSALRQMALAYASYSTDHNQRLMPGYIDASMFSPGQPFADLTVTLPDGTIVNPADAQSYVWRLAPYANNTWETFFVDIKDPGVISALQGDFNRISERPAFGMNSIFVGGDSAHGGSYVTNRNPWTGQDVLAATRLSEVKNPSRLILFGPSAKAGTGNDAYEDEVPGFCELRPPFTVLDAGDPANATDDLWSDQQWCFGKARQVFRHPGGDYIAGGGLPIIRSGSTGFPVAHLDGSAAVLQMNGDIWVEKEVGGSNKLLADMSRWYAFQVGLRMAVSSDCP